MDDTESARLQLEALLKRHKVPGCSVAARRGDQALSFRFGSADPADGRPVDDDTVFHLFSGTKLFTAAALMRLCERGAIDLDASIASHFSDLALRHPITPRQLASHSSGLPDTLRGFLAIHFQADEPPSTAVALSRYRTHKGKPPGQKAAYRNVNYAILGELISRVSGAPYAQFVEDEILKPLGSAATFDYSAESRPHAAVGTIGRFNLMRWLFRLLYPKVAKRSERARHGSLVSLTEFSLDTAAIGGLVGRAEDFLPLATECLAKADGVLTTESKREMLTMQARGQAGIVSAEGVGLGWKLGRHGGVKFWNHEGGGNGFTSEIRIYPDHDLGVVILMNATMSRKLSRLAHEMCEVLRAA